MSEYIERGALLEKLKKHHDCVMQDPAITKLVKWREAICYGRHKNLVEQAPAADVVAVKHGRWLDGRCTNCAWEAPDFVQYEGYELDDWEPTPHCPRCGAAMDGG